MLIERIEISTFIWHNGKLIQDKEDKLLISWELWLILPWREDVLFSYVVFSFFFFGICAPEVSTVLSYVGLNKNIQLFSKHLTALAVCESLRY